MIWTWAAIAFGSSPSVAADSEEILVAMLSHCADSSHCCCWRAVARCCRIRVLATDRMQDSPPSCLWFVAGRCAAGYGADEIDDASAAAAVVALEGPKRRFKTQLNLKTFF